MEVAQDRAEDAEYKVGYLYMTLPFKAKTSVEEYSQAELGTFIHEYVHFLQNISTPWGLYESMRLYERIASFLRQIAKIEDEIIYVPVEEDYKTEKEHILKILHYGRGLDKDNRGNSVYNLKLAEKSNFRIHRSLVDVGGRRIPKIILEFNTVSNGRVSLLFGAWAIKESMAALIQKRIDPSSIERHAEIPYSLISRLAQDLFPDIAGNEDMLVALCYASLFSMSPAQTFIDLASYANDNNNLKLSDILNMHFTGLIQLHNDDHDFESFCENISSKYISILSKLLVVPLNYIPKIIDAARFRKGNHLLLTFLKEDLDLNLIKEILEGGGLPFVLGTADTSSIPSIDSENDALEITNLMGYETIFQFLTNNPPSCPRKKACISTGIDISSCDYTPWIREEDCPMTLMAKWMGLSDKHIIRK